MRIELELLRVNWEGDFTGINEFIEHFIKVRMRKVETPPHIKRLMHHFKESRPYFDKMIGLLVRPISIKITEKVTVTLSIFGI